MKSLFYKFIFIITLIVLYIKCENPVRYKNPNSFAPQTNNIAFNNGTFKYPSPVESSEGWGGASWKWHLIDGERWRSAGWMYGLGFTGGIDELIDTCGWRQVTIDFGKPRAFNRIVIFNETGLLNVPNDYFYLYWNDMNNQWDTAAIITNKHKEDKKLLDYQKKIQNTGVIVEDTFKTVYSRKVQYKFNNCNMNHGWINEFEVYNDKPGDRPACLIYESLTPP